MKKGPIEKALSKGRAALVLNIATSPEFLYIIYPDRRVVTEGWHYAESWFESAFSKSPTNFDTNTDGGLSPVFVFLGEL